MVTGAAGGASRHAVMLLALPASLFHHSESMTLIIAARQWLAARSAGVSRVVGLLRLNLPCLIQSREREEWLGGVCNAMML